MSSPEGRGRVPRSPGGLTYHRGAKGTLPGEVQTSDESREFRVLLGRLVGKMRRISYDPVQSQKQRLSPYSVIWDSAGSAHWPGQASKLTIAASNYIAEGATPEGPGNPKSRMVLVATHR
ncbi:hypothetical protein ASPCADRAFT_130227 [Aspergillus carbonarius ITEM 5010]|uniref:Uncharacterized protein n=1 Tax=Aspergillus carbonarius (strain ITEM 5010) TaxID=602072 RepID=A0A1R3RN53_ASPC5|nr:hypothetical protein ASPCADRAFT_130227 [Aspergillus carbonarius ITEM 5010]